MFSEGGSNNMLLIVIVILGAAAMFFMSRRTKKQQTSVSDFKASLGPGVEIMTQAGQLGTIVSVDGDAITIDSAGTRSVWVSAAIVAIPAQFRSAADTAFGRDGDDDGADFDTELGESSDSVDLPSYGEHDDATPTDPADGPAPGDRA